MSNIEIRMARAPLPEPPPGLRAPLLARARREHRWRTTERVWRWALVVGAALVLLLNLHFSRSHERQMAALTGPPGVQRSVDTKVLVQRLERRQRVLTAWSSGEFPSALKEELL